MQVQGRRAGGSFSPQERPEGRKSLVVATLGGQGQANLDGTSFECALFMVHPPPSPPLITFPVFLDRFFGV